MLTVLHIVFLLEYKGNCALGGTDLDKLLLCDQCAHKVVEFVADMGFAVSCTV